MINELVPMIFMLIAIMLWCIAAIMDGQKEYGISFIFEVLSLVLWIAGLVIHDCI